MVIVLDTAVLIGFERKNPNIVAKLKQLSHVHPIAKTTFLNRSEFLIGINGKSPQNQKLAKEILEKLPVLHTTNQTADIITALRLKYDAQGKMLPLADLIVASLAIEHHATLVTLDHVFSRIEELQSVIL